MKMLPIIAAVLSTVAVYGRAPAPQSFSKDSVKTSVEEAIFFLSGVSAMEELSAHEMEKYEHFLSHPLNLNTDNRSILTSSGLLSDYQAAAILEYRKTHGDILSFSELMLVDGMGEKTVMALKPFTSLKMSNQGKSGYKDKVSGSITARYNLTSGFAFKSSIRFGDRFRLALGSNSASLAIYGKKHLEQVVIGDYNVRFGQGLLLWSGLSLSGYSGVTAFNRHGTGISPCSSFSGDGHMKGLACDWVFGPVSVEIFGSADGTAGTIIRKISKRNEFGASLVYDSGSFGGSADFKFGLGRAVVFGEAGWSGKKSVPCAVAGVMISPEYEFRYAFLCKYDSGISGAAGIQFRSINSTLEMSSKQVKSINSYSKALTFRGMTITPSIRICERFRSGDKDKWRSDIRFDADIDFGKWKAHGRFNLVHCRETAWLWYAELGRKGPLLTAFLRGSLFKIDNWDDRIYVYERDAPGNFNVPAFYGRGWRASLVASLHIGKKLRNSLNIRLSMTKYPGSDKPDGGEMRLQYSLKF